MMFCPRSLSAVSVTVLLERLSWMIGTSVAPYLSMSGGVMLRGMYFSTTSAELPNCEMARLTSAPSCR